MTASEKLRRLDEQFEKPASKQTSKQWLAHFAALRFSLPALIAVVDQFEGFVTILERSRDPWREIEERLRNVAPELLAALDEALEEK